ncbi:hypothetical protein [Halomonas tibetensis]|uniref:Uncharacterized protein n=1 Tax=Halomonas tibetensis TaxID=2259590 RepID=A0ABV7B9S4_9GAMM
MANPHLFDSDIDYQRAGMNAAALKVEALEEGDETALESFTAYLEAKGVLTEIVHEWAAGHRRLLKEWAKAAAWADEVEAGEAKAERLGLM